MAKRHASCMCINSPGRWALFPRLTMRSSPNVVKMFRCWAARGTPKVPLYIDCMNDAARSGGACKGESQNLPADTSLTQNSLPFKGCIYVAPQFAKPSLLTVSLGHSDRQPCKVDRRSEEVKSLSRVRLFVTPWTVACQAPLSMGFSRQEYWSGLPFPSPEDLPNPGTEPASPAFQADALSSEPPGKVDKTDILFHP